jgi:hypothetical protein
MNISCVHRDIPHDLTLAVEESSHPPRQIEMKQNKNLRRTRGTPGRTAPHGQTACYPRTVRQVQEQQPEPETARTKPPIRPWISQTA